MAWFGRALVRGSRTTAFHMCTPSPFPRRNAPRQCILRRGSVQHMRGWFGPQHRGATSKNESGQGSGRADMVSPWATSRWTHIHTNGSSQKQADCARAAVRVWLAVRSHHRTAGLARVLGLEHLAVDAVDPVAEVVRLERRRDSGGRNLGNRQALAKHAGAWATARAPTSNASANKVQFPMPCVLPAHEPWNGWAAAHVPAVLELRRVVVLGQELRRQGDRAAIDATRRRDLGRVAHDACNAHAGWGKKKGSMSPRLVGARHAWVRVVPPCVRPGEQRCRLPFPCPWWARGGSQYPGRP